MFNSNQRKKHNQEQLSFLNSIGFTFKHTEDDTIKAFRTEEGSRHAQLWGEYRSLEQALVVIKEMMK